MARPKAAQPMAASAVFIKRRENFLSILQHDEQQPVRPAIVFDRFSVARLIFVSGQKLAVLLNQSMRRRRAGVEIRHV